MLLLLFLAIGFYLYKTGEWQRIFYKIQSHNQGKSSEARRIIDMRYASGKISEEEYLKLKNLL